MNKLVSLCPACTTCPTVEITEDTVRIGENENVVTLSHYEWNVLVRPVKAGELEGVK